MPAVAALLLGMGFVLRTHRAFVGVQVPDEAFRAYFFLRSRFGSDPHVALQTLRTMCGVLDLAACALVYRLMGALALRSGARLVALGVVCLAPMNVLHGISSPMVPLVKLAMVAALLVHLKTRTRVSAVVVCALPLLSPIATAFPGLGAMSADAVVRARLPQLWGATHSMRFDRTVAATFESFESLLRAPGFGDRISALLIGVTFALLLSPELRTRVAMLRVAPFFAAALVSTLILGVTLQGPRLDPTPTLAFVIVLAIAVDRIGKDTPLLAVAAIGGLAFLGGPQPMLAPVAKAPFRVACSRCDRQAFFEPDAYLAIETDRAARHALRRGQLLRHLRERGIEHLGLDERYYNPALLGERFREQLLAEPGGFRIVRDPSEKDAQIRVDLAPTVLREHLGDGWRVGEWSLGVGRAAEIVFTLAKPKPGRVELELEAVHEETKVEVELDGTKVATFTLKQEPAWYAVPIDAATARAGGRHRIRLSYASGAVEHAANTGWWRMADAAAPAIRAHAIRHLWAPALPPEGPALGDPDGALVLHSGFMSVEGTGASAAVWANAKRAELVFTVGHPERPHRLTLEAGPPPPSDGADGQKITVLLGEKSLGEIVLPPARVSTHGIEIPAFVLGTGVNQLSLAFARVSNEGGVARAAYVRAVSLAAE